MQILDRHSPAQYKQAAFVHGFATSKWKVHLQVAIITTSSTFRFLLNCSFCLFLTFVYGFCTILLGSDYGVLTLFQGKRLFIKDIIHYLVPPNGAPASIAPSLERKERGVGTFSTSRTNGASNGITDGTSKMIKGAPYPFATEAEHGNPTIMPKEILDEFHFTFLIRHPRYSIPSYYRCTVPPLDKLTGFYDFMPSEAGYDEVRRVFDYLRSIGQVGPNIATRDTKETETSRHDITNGHINGHTNGITNGRNGVDICVVDADDLLDSPKLIVEAFCKSVGIEYDDGMLKWDSEEDQKQAREAFEKWPGFHEDAMNSCDLKPRMHVSCPSSFV